MIRAIVINHPSLLGQLSIYNHKYHPVITHGNLTCTIEIDDFPSDQNLHLALPGFLHAAMGLMTPSKHPPRPVCGEAAGRFAFTFAADSEDLRRLGVAGAFFTRAVPMAKHLGPTPDPS